MESVTFVVRVQSVKEESFWIRDNLEIVVDEETTFKDLTNKIYKDCFETFQKNCINKKQALEYRDRIWRHDIEENKFEYQLDVHKKRNTHLIAKIKLMKYMSSTLYRENIKKSW
eukprot:UN13585